MTEAEYEEFTKKKMTDVGTRYEHYTELLSMFETGTELLRERLEKNKSRNRLEDLDNLFQFAVAAKVIKAHIDVLSGFSDSVQQYKLGKVVDGIEQEAKVWRA